MAVNFQRDAELGDQSEDLVVGVYTCEEFSRAGDSTAARTLSSGLLGVKRRRVVVEPLPSLHYFDAFFDIGDGGYLSVEPKTIKQLWPQLAFFRIAGADQDKPRRMRD